jgi:hypothetical protein
VLEEGVVLAGDEGEHDVLRDLLHADHLAPTLEELTDGAALAVEHAGGQGGSVVFEGAEIGQIPQQDQVGDARCEDAPHAEHHREPHQDSYPPGPQ